GPDHPVLLHRDQRVQPVGLGLQHLLQHLVLAQLPAGQRQGPLQELGEVGGVAELLAELEEEAVHLPADGVAEELLLATREQAVDGGPRDPRRGGDVVDRGLGHPPTGDGVVGAAQHLEAGVVHRSSSPCAPAAQSPSSRSRPIVTPGRSPTAFTASSTPGMNDVRSYESCRMLSDCPVVPSSTSSWATRPRRRTECTWMPPAPTPPRAPSTTVVVVGSAAHSSDAVAIRSTVSMAVPDGA